MSDILKGRLTIQQAAARANLTRNAITKAIERGRLQAEWNDTLFRWFIREEAFSAWLHEPLNHKVGPKFQTTTKAPRRPRRK